MLGIIVTFPISLPAIFIWEFFNDATSVFDRPWKLREIEEARRSEEEEAKKKTYAYVYSKTA